MDKYEIVENDLKRIAIFFNQGHIGFEEYMELRMPLIEILLSAERPAYWQGTN
jgi:hypothetical protein